jgi:hypothetical protein
VDYDSVDDSRVDVNESVPQAIGRGDFDVSAGTTPPGHTRIVLEVVKGCYEVYISSIAFTLRPHW